MGKKPLLLIITCCVLLSQIISVYAECPNEELIYYRYSPGCSAWGYEGKHLSKKEDKRITWANSSEVKYLFGTGWCSDFRRCYQPRQIVECWPSFVSPIVTQLSLVTESRKSKMRFSVLLLRRSIRPDQIL